MGLNLNTSALLGASALLLSACATSPVESVSVRGTVVEQDGNYYLQSQNATYHLNATPQLRYNRYLGKQLAIQGEILSECSSDWAGDDDNSRCITADKVSLITSRGEKEIYDWEEINREDYFF